MTDSEQKDIFCRALNRLLYESGHTQTEVAATIGVSQQVMNSWVRGISMPRMGKIQLLADYFGVKKSQLIGEEGDTYFLTPDVADTALMIHDRPELKEVVYTLKHFSDDDLILIREVLETIMKHKTPL